MLVSMIEDVARELRMKKQVLESSEKRNDQSRMAASVLPDDNTFDRFTRAETAYDRRLYRSLSLLAMMQVKDSKILPG
jgi:hypothetical protein